MKKIEKEIVLITGGGGGLGKALGIRFAKKGATVVLWDVSEKGLNDAFEAVTSAGGICKTYKCDITNREEVYALAKQVREEVGIVTILVNNAGIVSCKYLLDIPDQSIIKTMEVNAMAHFWTLKAFLPDMMKANHGHIVTISSIAGITGTERLSDYCASKFANIGLEESLRYELENQGLTGIHTTLVCPYFINTGLFDGVKIPSFLSILKVDDVADYILIAILTNTQYVVLPKIAHFLFFLKG
ncbi:epidermal retinol dehydrogenase 2-like isoform X1 [Dinothrombium tinctorium]|uniref:Short-chain dehydrogenase/reductase 3 n=1 Tax=Dinothrombium tinctorium TaxID=1965070 RepID=A0A3S3PJH0_9ACAR|nr:epidermal retinol dehydrogenase 2-like isoform X1 [Dinothrombium tinctorium]RWS17030.1 epidermal retinol dehydrogenase 2-like isoform X1 [Dinothrombium tinctorium]